MDNAILVGIVGLVVTNLVGAVKVLRAVGRLEERMTLMWDWYLDNHPDSMGLHRRRGDLWRHEHAHDDPGEE